MPYGWLAAGAIAGYGVIAGVVAWRLLFPGLGRRYPPPLPWMEAHFLDLDDGRVHVNVFVPDGAAAPVCVLQHGLGECGGTLAGEADLLRRLGFGIVLMDLPGHGRSPRGATTYGVREGRLLRQALEALGLTDRVTLLWGRSVGAAAVLWTAPAMPRLAAVIADGMFDNPLRSIARHPIERPGFRPLIVLLPGVLGWLYLFLLARHATRFPSDVVETVAVPILFITGSRDVGMPPRVQRRLLARARHEDSRMVEVPEAGHYGCFSRAPEPFEAWLLRYGADGVSRDPAVGVTPGTDRSRRRPA